MAAVGPSDFHSTTTLSNAPTGGSATLTDVILANSQGVVTATQSLGPISIPITTSSLSSQIPATSGYSTSTSSSSSASGTLVTTPATSHTQSPTTSNTTAAGSSGRTGGHSASSDGRLSNGTVAGVVVAAAIGLSLIASILTFLVMRRRRSSKGNQDEQSSNGHYALKSGISSQQSSPGSRLESKAPFVTGTLSSPITNESHFPQPADDATVESRVKTMLDQIELHVENFYQQNSELRSPVISDSLAMFESPSLPNSLASLLEQTTIATPIIKHALAYFITSCISTNSKIDSTLLPAEFVTLPRTVATAKRGGSAKPGRSFLGPIRLLYARLS